MHIGLVPSAIPETQPFWDAAARGKLALPTCRACARPHFFPRALCPHCGSRSLQWDVASGSGTLASYVINEKPTPPFERGEPQIIALVTLAEGPRLMTNLIDVAPSPAALALGMPLTVSFVERGGVHLPVFRPTRKDNS